MLFHRVALVRNGEHTEPGQLLHTIHRPRGRGHALVCGATAVTSHWLDRIAAGESQTLEFKASFDGSIQRKERFAYPLPALREGLLNAVVHRSYTDPSDIQIKIFDDKITLFSPGTFYGGLTVAEIRADNYRSSLRNKLVAEGFYLVNAIEKYGSGFIRIRRALQDYPEVQFDIEEKFGGVMATFTRKSRPVDSGAPQVTSQVTSQVEQLLVAPQDTD